MFLMMIVKRYTYYYPDMRASKSVQLRIRREQRVSVSYGLMETTIVLVETHLRIDHGDGHVVRSSSTKRVISQLWIMIS